MRRRDLIAMTAGAVAAWSTRARAQTYPSKPIRLIVPFTAGSGVDACARLIAQHLPKRIGQSVMIDNRPGAGSTIGTKAASEAAADGYTLLFTGQNIFFFPVLYPNLNFDPLKRLAPVATIFTYSHVIGVASSLPVRTIAEFIAYANANPGSVVFGYGLGSTPHIIGASFKQATGADLVFIPYRGGEQARADLLGGRVHMNIAPVETLLSLIHADKVRPLAFTGPARSAHLPDVPTMIESGFPGVGYNPDVWFGIFAPPGTDNPVIDRLNATSTPA